MSKKALVIGNGLMARPCVDMLVKTSYKTTCASSTQSKLDDLAKVFPSIATVKVDVLKDRNILQELIRDTDVVISLLPVNLDIPVALICIEEKTSLVTTNYIDNDMRNLHEKAVAAGITIMVEAGLDPGLDHMMAVKFVDALKADGGQVTECMSLCGGVPAETSTAGPLKYKFSWFPRGTLLSAFRPAKFLLEGKIFEFEKILEHPENVTSCFKDYGLECTPNKDSLEYRDVYGIPDTPTIYRGTIRYQGYARLLRGLVTLGLMQRTDYPELARNASNLTWRELITVLLGLPTESTRERVEKAVLEKLNHDYEQFKCIQDLGLLSDKIVPRNDTPLDSLCAYLAKTIVYGPGEQDLVLMWVKVSAKLSSGKQRTLEARLVEKGTPIGGQSAMSKTVGLTAAFCADLIVSGAVQRKGVILPNTKDIYEPVLAKVAAEGVTFNTTASES